MSLAVRDITWLAGFIDGEGCFYIGKTRTPKVQIAQKDPWPLLKIQQMIGGSIYRFKGSAKPSESYNVLMITGRKAVGVMMTLYQFLSPRRQAKITEILGIWRAIPLRGKCNLKEFCIRGHRLDEANSYLRPTGGRECEECRIIYRDARKRYAI